MSEQINAEKFYSYKTEEFVAIDATSMDILGCDPIPIPPDNQIAVATVWGPMFAPSLKEVQDFLVACIMLKEQGLPAIGMSDYYEEESGHIRWKHVWLQQTIKKIITTTDENGNTTTENVKYWEVDPEFCKTFQESETITDKDGKVITKEVMTTVVDLKLCTEPDPSRPFSGCFTLRLQMAQRVLKETFDMDRDLPECMHLERP